MGVINGIAPLKKIRIKSKTQDWFDGEVLSAISDRNKLFKIFKRTRQLEDEKLYKKAKHSTQKLIKNKKKNYIENKLKEYVSKPKELW